MSEENERLCLEAFCPYLRHHLTLEHMDDLAFNFHLAELFSEEQKSQIQDCQDHRKRDLFIEHFQNAIPDPRCFAVFKHNLESKNAGHIVDHILGETADSSIMMELWNESLCNSYKKFQENFDPAPVLDLYGPELFDDTTRETIRAVNGRTQQVTSFFTNIVKRDGWFPKLLSALEDPRCGDYSHLAKLLDPDGDRKGLVFINLIEACVPAFEDSLCPEDILDSMKCLTEGSRNYIRSLPTTKRQVNAFLNILISSEQGWFEQLIVGLQSCANNKYQNLLELLDPICCEDEEITSSEPTKTIKRESLKSVLVEICPKTHENQSESASARSSSDETEYLVVKQPSAETAIPSVTERQKQNPDDSKDSSNTESQDPFPLRPYQRELAEPAMDGKNCMIVAPTGSGKSYLAYHLCVHHCTTREKSKIIFLGPQTKQHCSDFREEKPEHLRTGYIVGEMNNRIPVQVEVERNLDVVFMNADILRNLLSDKLLDISSISLLIFDECHHAKDNEPYNQIMRIYLNKKLKKKKEVLPQIVGLTASPGSGNSENKAFDHIVTLLANLDVTIPPVQVRRERKNLEQFVYDKEDHVFTVTKRKCDKFAEGIKEIMQAIENRIQKDFDQFKNVLGQEKLFLPRAEKGSKAYETDAKKSSDESALIEDDTARKRFKLHFDHLIVYNDSVILNDHAHNLAAEKFITKELFAKECVNDIRREMKQVYDQMNLVARDVVSPLLERLVEILFQQFQESPDSRCIVFVETRVLAWALPAYLNENCQLQKVDAFAMQLTGKHAPKQDYGMTSAEQENAIEKFKEGSCNVLVSTSVAQESLNIPKCNLIVCYDYSTDDVAHTQRKGRCRANGSKSILLTYKNSPHEKRHDENVFRVELLQTILRKFDDLQANQLADFTKEIRSRQEKNLQSAKIDKLQRQAYLRELESRKSNKVFEIRCLYCKVLTTESDNLRFTDDKSCVVADKSFRDLARFKSSLENEICAENDDVPKVGKILCKNDECGFLWGELQRRDGLPSPILTSKKFVVINSELKYRNIIKKWNKAPFRIGPLTDDDKHILLQLQYKFPVSSDSSSDSD